MKDKETIIAVHASDQPGTILGKMVNYPALSVYGNSEEQLIERAKEVLQIEKDMIDNILTGECELEIKQVATEDDWLWSDVNILQWEIDRLQYILSNKEDIRKVLLEIITNTVTKVNGGDTEHSMYTAAKIVEAIIKYDNK